MSRREDVNAITDAELLEAQMGPYMQSRPFRDDEGSVYSPGGTLFARGDKYFDFQRQIMEKASNIGYEDMSIDVLAKRLAYAEYEDDLTTSENVTDALLERLASEEARLVKDDEKYTPIKDREHTQKRSDELWAHVMDVKDSEFQRLYDEEVLGGDQGVDMVTDQFSDSDIDLGRRLMDVDQEIREADIASWARKGIFGRIREKLKRSPYGRQPYEHKRRIQAGIAAAAIAGSGIIYAITQSTPSVRQGKLMETPSAPNKRPRTVFDSSKPKGKHDDRSRQHESAKISTEKTSVTKRTIELPTGGSVWGQSKILLGRYGILATKNQNVNEVKNAVLMKYDIPEEAAYGLPVGAKYIVPKKVIRTLRKNSK